MVLEVLSNLNHSMIIVNRDNRSCIINIINIIYNIFIYIYIYTYVAIKIPALFSGAFLLFQLLAPQPWPPAKCSVCTACAFCSLPHGLSQLTLLGFQVTLRLLALRWWGEVSAQSGAKQGRAVNRFSQKHWQRVGVGSEGEKEWQTTSETQH